ncbi:MAG: Methionine--tRNA ligase [Alphaproteobacteria bacterium MarineAlpha5_Bin9]|nr:MAG: Methionine--tRNA ligase [Alphaproteobacteria bacterium MarineAlpha5_Bin9]|tara:strand:+ start:2308 stop:3837 length:1530 start_codon:yes stop_codon:yes gene_type:complete
MNSFYITTPIYYVNDKPHIGHAYTTIACDIISRYNKLIGNDVFFLTGTDEHGQKVEKAAAKSSMNTKIFVDKMAQSFKDLVPYLKCNIDYFIRTTDENHIKASQSLWSELIKNDEIYLSNYEGWYSIRDEAFYSDSELTKINNKFIAPSGSEVEWVKEESYFFRLSKWEKPLLDFYKNNPEAISPKSRYNEVISFIKSGLKDLSISRTTFKWGVPVPNNTNHVMYVWIDALCNYLTAIGYPDKENLKFKKLWPATHVVGKDILRFHSVYWPAFLMAVNLKPPKKVFAHGWWTNEGQKISKSLGNIIDPYDIVSQYGIDQIRFFLFREVPFGNDGDFSKNAISNRVNSDLSNNLGNLIQRVCSFINKNCNSKVLNTFDKSNSNDNFILNLSIEKFDNYNKFMKNLEIDKAIKEIFELLSETNSYIDKESPWKLKNNDEKRMNTILSVAVEIIRRASLLLYPIIPTSCEKIFSIIDLNKNSINLNNYKSLPDNSFFINESFPVFPRIEVND